MTDKKICFTYFNVFKQYWKFVLKNAANFLKNGVKQSHCENGSMKNRINQSFLLVRFILEN